MANKYKIKKVTIGIYEYDTIFIDVNNKEYQIPVVKNKKGIEIGKELIIEDIFSPIK